MCDTKNNAETNTNLFLRDVHNYHIHMATAMTFLVEN